GRSPVAGHVRDSTEEGRGGSARQRVGAANPFQLFSRPPRPGEALVNCGWSERAEHEAARKAYAPAYARSSMRAQDRGNAVFCGVGLGEWVRLETRGRVSRQNHAPRQTANQTLSRTGHGAWAGSGDRPIPTTNPPRRDYRRIPERGASP